jgi:hypothetical protein
MIFQNCPPEFKGEILSIKTTFQNCPPEFKGAIFVDENDFSKNATRTGLNYLGCNWVEFGKSKILIHCAFLSHNLF